MISARAPKSTREAHVLPRNRAKHDQSPRRNTFPRVTKRTRHPDKLVKEFLHATGVRWIRDSAAGGIKKLSCCTEIDVRENCDQAELAQHRQQTLDHARAAEWTG